MNDHYPLNRAVIVTGAGSGLGRSMAIGLAEVGCSVAAVDINIDRLNDLSNESQTLEGEILPICLDISETPNCISIVEKTLERFERVDALVNNAGVSIAIINPEFRRNKVMFWDVPEDKWDEMFDTNVKAAFILARTAAPFMIKQKWGRIVNVTTSLDTMIRPSWTPYGPSKAALEAASANWAGDLDDKNVTVNVLIPGGPANTNFVPGISQSERAQLVQPDVMKEPIKWLISDASEEFTARRLIAHNWDNNLAPHQAAQAASTSIAWKSLGRQAATEPVPS